MMARQALKIIVSQVRFIGLLLHYVLLHVQLLYLLVCKFLLKVAGAALIEAVKIEYCIKTLSNADRIIFAACIAVSIYAVALAMLIRT